MIWLLRIYIYISGRGPISAQTGEWSWPLSCSGCRGALSTYTFKAMHPSPWCDSYYNRTRIQLSQHAKTPSWISRARSQGSACQATPGIAHNPIQAQLGISAPANDWDGMVCLGCPGQTKAAGAQRCCGFTTHHPKKTHPKSRMAQEKQKELWSFCVLFPTFWNLNHSFSPASGSHRPPKALCRTVPRGIWITQSDSHIIHLHRIIWHASSRGVPSNNLELEMLKESQGNPTRSWRNPNKNYKMLEKSNPILRDICFFLEISQRALHTINSKSTDETGNAQGKLEFREHVKATKNWKPKKIQINWEKLDKNTKSWKILTKAKKKNN